MFYLGECTLTGKLMSFPSYLYHTEISRYYAKLACILKQIKNGLK